MDEYFFSAWEEIHNLAIPLSWMCVWGTLKAHMAGMFFFSKLNIKYF